jgi:hypothetical protein
MCNLTGSIPDDACRRTQVWAAEYGTSTLRVSLPFHRKNAPRKASFVSAYPSLTQILPVTYHPQPLTPPNPK